ncbi:MAG: 4Fe-4S dicluster domain-containing protein [Gammaproteobacteria bacterium]|nr:4Fe-4S dicluster domain-containing protein [Gammaproteobacteria bacterium]
MKTSMGSGSTRIPLRQQVEELCEQSIGTCYQCGNCSSGCPMGPWMDALPNQLIRRLQLGLEDTTRFASPWVCASCFACGVRCPKGIDVPRVMEALRVVGLRSGEDHIGPHTIEKKRLSQLPQIALVAHMRKATG